METPEDVETTPLTKPKQTRNYVKTPAREEAIKRMVEGKKKKAELNRAEKIIKAYETKEKHKQLQEPVEEEEEEEEEEVVHEPPPPPPKPVVKQIVKKVIKKPTKVVQVEEESESEEEVIVVKKKPKKKIVYVSESEEEEPIVKQPKEREMKSQKTAKSGRQSAISIGGTPRMSREDYLSMFV